MKVETEAMFFATQEQAIRTNYVKHKIEKTAQSTLCRMCGKKSETVSHTVSECDKLAQKQYRRRHNTVARIANWKLCGEYQLKRDIRVSKKEKEKIERYQELKTEIKRLWNIRNIKVISVNVGALDSTSKKLKNCIELGIVISTALV